LESPIGDKSVSTSLGCVSHTNKYLSQIFRPVGIKIIEHHPQILLFTIFPRGELSRRRMKNSEGWGHCGRDAVGNCLVMARNLSLPLCTLLCNTQNAHNQGFSHGNFIPCRDVVVLDLIRKRVFRLSPAQTRTNTRLFVSETPDFRSCTYCLACETTNEKRLGVSELHQYIFGPCANYSLRTWLVN
jgi:hypothetical protein